MARPTWGTCESWPRSWHAYVTTPSLLGSPRGPGDEAREEEGRADAQPEEAHEVARKALAEDHPDGVQCQTRR